MNKEKQLKILDEICPLDKGYRSSVRLVRKKFFDDIQTELQAYLLGFYTADGSFNAKRNTLTIKVSECDKEIIDLYKVISPDAYCQHLEATKMIGPEGKEINVKPVERINIANKHLGETITNLGLGERKTYKDLRIPDMREDLIRHFIRGYFDGDGCITYHASPPNINNREKNYKLKVLVQWVSKTRNLLDMVCSFLKKHDIVGSVLFIKRKDYFVLNICRKEHVKKLFRLLYTDSNFYLSRKYNKFNCYANTEESQLIADLRNAQELSASNSNNAPKSAERPIS